MQKSFSIFPKQLFSPTPASFKQNLSFFLFLFYFIFLILFFSLEEKNIILIIHVGQPMYTFRSHVCFPAQKWRREWAQWVAGAPLLGWKVSTQHYWRMRRWSWVCISFSYFWFAFFWDVNYQKQLHLQKNVLVLFLNSLFGVLAFVLLCGYAL